MFKIYMQYIILSFKILVNLHHYQSFLEFKDNKLKNRKLQLKQVDQKIKFARKKGNMPEKEQVFLSLFYEIMCEDDSKTKQNEFTSLFSMLFYWHYSLNEKSLEAKDLQE